MNARSDIAGSPMIWHLPPTGMAPPGPLTVRPVADLPSLAAMAGEWNDLVARSGVRHPFATHEWIRCWWDAFGDGHELKVLRVDQDGELVGLAPLMQRRTSIYGIPVLQVELIANAHTPEADLLTAGRDQTVREEIWRALAAQDWDVLRLCDLPPSSPTFDALLRLAQADGFLVGIWPSRRSPLVRLRGTWAEYERTLDAKRQSELRRRRKALAALGPIRVERVAGSEAAALEEAFDLERMGWKGEAGTAIASDLRTRTFYRRAVTEMAGRGWVSLTFLRVGERRVAFQLSLEYAGRILGLKLGHHPSFASGAPQKQLLQAALQEAFDRGLETYEFQGHDERWKMEWATETVPYRWLFVFRPHSRGRLLHAAKFGVVPWLGRWPGYQRLRQAIWPPARPAGGR